MSERGPGTGRGGFDRLRPRTPEPAVLGDVSAPHTVDVDGKRALFSGAYGVVPPVGPGVVVDCSRCGVSSRVGGLRALRMLTPSLHVFPLHRSHPSYLRCPACGRASWVRLRVGG